jgi:hypothetical protein
MFSATGGGRVSWVQDSEYAVVRSEFINSVPTSFKKFYSIISLLS